MVDDQMKVETASEAVDYYRYKFLRKCFENVVDGLEFHEEKLKADQESFRKSTEERLKQIEEKEKVFEERRLLQEKDIRDLDLHRKEVGSIQVREKNLNEKEKSLEVQEKKLETMKKHMKERFLQVSMREKILDLRREELLGKEEELVGKRTLLEAKEKVLGCRNEQLLAREKQLELKENILNLQNEEEIDLSEYEEYEHSRNMKRKRSKIDAEKQMSLQTNEASVPPEEILPKKNLSTGEHVVIPRNYSKNVRVRLVYKKLKAQQP